MKQRTLFVLIGLGLLVVGTAIALVLLRVVFFVPFRSPSGGMYPSIAAGSHIFVNRADKNAEYGRVVVFHYPEKPDQDFDKRVVGLAGDKIETSGTTLRINGWEVPHCTVGKNSYDETDMPARHTGTLEVEWLGDETYLVFHDDNPFMTSSGPFVVKSGEYFVMGDNRDNSHDSRMWFGGSGGGVPNDFTVGRVRMGKVALPRGAESLRPALDACLVKQPAKTRP